MSTILAAVQGNRRMAASTGGTTGMLPRRLPGGCLCLASHRINSGRSSYQAADSGELAPRNEQRYSRSEAAYELSEPGNAAELLVAASGDRSASLMCVTEAGDLIL